MSHRTIFRFLRRKILRMDRTNQTMQILVCDRRSYQSTSTRYNNVKKLVWHKRREGEKQLAKITTKPEWVTQNNINWKAVTRNVVTNKRKIERNFPMLMRYMAKDSNIVTSCLDWNETFNAILKKHLGMWK